MTLQGGRDLLVAKRALSEAEFDAAADELQWGRDLLVAERRPRQGSVNQKGGRFNGAATC